MSGVVSTPLPNSDRDLAFGEVLALLEDELAKAKDRGDTHAAEVIEVLRAKVKARSLRIHLGALAAHDP